MNHEGDCRTASAKPGLLKSKDVQHEKDLQVLEPYNKDYLYFERNQLHSIYVIKQNICVCIVILLFNLLSKQPFLQHTCFVSLDILIMATKYQSKYII